MEMEQDTPAQLTEALKQLQRQLLDLALEIADEIEESVSDAPLNQRVSALKALIDGVLKLEDRMPQPATQEKVYRIEYKYPDGTLHETPPWAEDDSREDEPVHGRRKWTPIWKDRVGEGGNS